MTPLLVTGATVDVGSHIVAELRARGVPARASVRDGAKARALLGEDVELVVGVWGAQNRSSLQQPRSASRAPVTAATDRSRRKAERLFVGSLCPAGPDTRARLGGYRVPLRGAGVAVEFREAGRLATPCL